MPCQEISMYALIFLGLLGDKFLNGRPFAQDRARNLRNGAGEIRLSSKVKPIENPLGWAGNCMELILKRGRFFHAQYFPLIHTAIIINENHDASQLVFCWRPMWRYINLPATILSLSDYKKKSELDLRFIFRAPDVYLLLQYDVMSNKLPSWHCLQFVDEKREIGSASSQNTECSDGDSLQTGNLTNLS